MRIILCVYLGLVTSTAVNAEEPANWASFRGGVNGVSSQRALPIEWATAKNILWEIALPGYGQSSPVVWGQSVYITAVEGDQREKGYVVSYDVTTGKERWRHQFEPTQKAKWSYTISRAAPTPCVDADGVYAFFEGGNLLKLDHAGKVLWSLSLVKEYGEFQGGHGIGASPTQSADTLFILIDHAGPSYLMAIDKKTGKLKWKTDRKGKMSWTSPLVATVHGVEMVIASSNGSVVGYNTKDGNEIWRVDDVAGNTLPSATIAGDLIVVGAGQSRGKEPSAEAKTNFAIKLTKVENTIKPIIAWKAKPGLASYATPLIYRDVAYFINEVGVITAVNAQTGKQLYSERAATGCWASPIAVGDYVFFFGKNGITTVIQAGNEWKVVSTNVLFTAEKPKTTDTTEPKTAGRGTGEYGDPIVYSAVPASNAWLVRTGSALYRISATSK